MRRFLLFLAFIQSLIGFAQSDIVAIGNIPIEIKETSGLIHYNGQLITHNDSDSAPQLYVLDIETLQIVRTVTVIGEENIDWEDISQDASHIYIGDIGNNRGTRIDLGILKISKEEFDSSDEVTAERITYLYEDQTDFTETDGSDFDAEALFVLDNDLIVLTKQWQSGGTVAYKIPKTPGAFLAERMDSYQVNGLITGATFDGFTRTLYLVGYSQLLRPFFVDVPEVNTGSVFSGNPIKTNLEIGTAQVEALTFSGDTFYATSEEFVNQPLVNSASQLFSFTLDGIDDPPDSGEEEEEIPVNDELIVYKSNDSFELFYELNSLKPIFGMGIFDSSGRMIRYTPLERITQNPIDISTFSQGVYHLGFFYDNKVISSPFLRD